MMDSLFYQAIDSDGKQVLLNKKYIVSAISKSSTVVILKTVVGDVFTLNIQFGNLTAELLQLSHKSS